MGLLLMTFLFGFAVLSGSGRNIGFQNAEEYAVWHREYGATLRLLGWIGLAVVGLTASLRFFWG